MIHPEDYIPNHWDGLFNPFWPGIPSPFNDASLAAFLDAQGIPLMPQQQYFDGYRLDAERRDATDNHDLKQRLGFSDVQPFTPVSAATARAVSAAIGPQDCDQ